MCGSHSLWSRGGGGGAPAPTAVARGDLPVTAPAISAQVQAARSHGTGRRPTAAFAPFGLKACGGAVRAPGCVAVDCKPQIFFATLPRRIPMAAASRRSRAQLRATRGTHQRAQISAHSRPSCGCSPCPHPCFPETPISYSVQNQKSLVQKRDSTMCRRRRLGQRCARVQKVPRGTEAHQMSMACVDRIQRRN